jgi:hypothetical protein
MKLNKILLTTTMCMLMFGCAFTSYIEDRIKTPNPTWDNTCYVNHYDKDGNYVGESKFRCR